MKATEMIDRSAPYVLDPENLPELYSEQGAETRLQRAFADSITELVDETTSRLCEVIEAFGRPLSAQDEAEAAALPPAQRQQVAAALEAEGHAAQAHRVRNPARHPAPLLAHRQRSIVIDNTTVFAPIPIRRLVVAGLPAGALTVVASSPGAGKSTLAIALALGAATGLSAFAGPVGRGGKAVMVLNEDSGDEIMRRFEAAMTHHGHGPKALQHPIEVFSADDPLVLFEKVDRSVAPVMTKAGDEFFRRMRQAGASLIVVDTFSSICRGLDENSVSDVQFAMSSLTKLAADTGAAILMATHTAKAAAGSNGDQNAVRGSSAIIGAARCVLTLGGLTADEAKRAGLSPDMARRWVRMDVAKNSYGPAGGTQWFERVAVKVRAVDPANPTAIVFEDSPVLVPSGRNGPVGQIADGQTVAALNAIRAGLPDGSPPLRSAKAGSRSAGAVIAAALNVSAIRAEAVVSALLKDGLLAVETWRDPLSRKDRIAVVVTEKGLKMLLPEGVDALE